MPCSCPVGRRPDLAAIDAALAALGTAGAESLSALAGRLLLSKSTLHRHREHLVPESFQDTRNEPERAGTEDGTTISPYVVHNPGDDPPTAPRKVVSTLIERRCIELRAAGKPYREIAAELCIDETHAADVVERVLIRTAKGTDAKADTARALDVERIDRLLGGLWSRATDPSRSSQADEEGEVHYDPSQDKAVERATKLLERRAKLLGLDEASGPSTVVNVLSLATNPHFEGFMSAILGALEEWPEAKASVVKAVRGEIEARRVGGAKRER